MKPDSGSADFEKLYREFLQWNGSGYTPEDFRYVTEKNNRADRLANLGIDQMRE